MHQHCWLFWPPHSWGEFLTGVKRLEVPYLGGLSPVRRQKASTCACRNPDALFLQYCVQASILIVGVPPEPADSHCLVAVLHISDEVHCLVQMFCDGTLHIEG